MKAVNLIPGESRRGPGRGGFGLAGVGPSSFGPAYAIVGLLAVAVLFVLISVLTGNTISSRKAKLATLRTRVLTETAEAQRLQTYVAFEQTAQQRAETVRQIAAARFDWHAALSDLSKVVPGNAAFQSLTGTIPGASSTAAATTGTTTAATGPVFALTGCTTSQDNVAALMTRLRLINGVTDVSLASSTKGSGSSSGTGVAVSGAAKGRPRGCPSNWPVFNMSISFNGATATGAAPSTATPVAGTTTTPGSAPTATTTATTGTVATTTSTGTGR